ncbi:LysR family transcriptional regulator [Vibrio navarrensis]|nr:LysR family transcriptional regulator [Vibrio navarrensis]EJL6394041.1 LysR family transcriptional regulator [Vibrio navarrensis]EKA5634802.1 LysR family transcriptional regulator [Vibrio navarrensis]
MSINQRILSLLPLLHQVIEQGSFQQAAKQLHLPRSSVSKKIMQLEELLGQPVLHRTTRQLRLTDLGEELLSLSHGLPTLLTEIDSLLDSAQTTPSGTVRISSATLFGQQALIPEIKALRALYPNITIQLSFDDSFTDLIAQNIDIAIRVGHLPDSQQVAKIIGHKQRCFAASPHYLSLWGRPTHPKQLAQHQCIIFKTSSSTHDHWAFQEKNQDTVTSVEVSSTLTTDDVRSMVDLARLDNGIIYADLTLLQPWLQNGELIEVLNDYVPAKQEPIQLLCIGRSSRSRAATVIWEELAKRLPPRLTGEN